MIVLLDIVDAGGVTWTLALEASERAVMKGHRYKGEMIWKPVEELLAVGAAVLVTDVRAVVGAEGAGDELGAEAGSSPPRGASPSPG